MTFFQQIHSNKIQGGLTPPTLVFVQTKERAQELFKELLYDGVNTLNLSLIFKEETIFIFQIYTSKLQKPCSRSMLMSYTATVQNSNERTRSGRSGVAEFGFSYAQSCSAGESTSRGSAW